MKVVITGAGGQLGTDIARECGKRGVTAYASGSRELDITNYQAVTDYLAGHPCDLVINCAAYNAVDDAEKNWKRAFLVNGIGVRNLATAINNQGGTLIHFSSDFVFDGQGTRPYTIADQPHPISRYGESKLLGEQFVRDLSARYYLIRLSWVFGPGKVNFVRKVVGWSRDSTELQIVDDQVSSPTYTRDIASAVLDLVQTDRFGLYHLTNSSSCSRYEWALHILDKIGWKGKVLPVSSEKFPSPAKRPAYSVLDNFGSPETLGYSLPDWKDATMRYLQSEGLA